MSKELEAIKRILERERKARKQAEEILESKSRELFRTNQELQALNTSLEKKVEQRTMEIRESEELHRSLFEQNPFPLFIIDVSSGKILTANRTAEELYGYYRTGFTGKSIHDLGEVPDQAGLRTLAIGHTTRWQTRHIVADKSFYDVEIFARGIWFQNHRAAITLVQDITLQKQATKQLQQSEEKYRGIIENLDLGLLEVDKDDTIVRAYPRFCEVFGYQEQDLIGKKARTILLPEHGVEVMDKQELIRKDGKPSVYEVEMRRGDGSICWVIISGAPILSTEGTFMGSIGVHLDISDRKQMEAELVDAKDLAEESVKVRETFMANMSHEIRTPMNAIIGLSELLSQSPLNSEQMGYLEAIRTSADNLLVIINDILDLSKINADKLELEAVSFSLPNLLKQLHQTLYYKAEDKGITLEYLFKGDLTPMVVGDPVRLNQVLMNLTNNAIKFTDSGGVTIEMSQVRTSLDSATIKFRVIDTGVGIAPDKIDTIFEVFTQEDVATSRKHGGTGLGLTISKRIVSLMGSTIEVESQKDVGTEFYFEIEFKVPEKEQLKNRVEVRHITGALEQEKKQVQSREPLAGIQVLIAEDDPINQLVAVKMLERLGASAEVAANGRIACDTLVEKPGAFDIILMDVNMPEMGGIEATQKIINEKITDIPIVALTANALKGDRERFLEAGMTEYLSKPFLQNDLVKTIQKCLGDTQPEAPLPADAEAAKSDSLATKDTFVQETLNIEKLDELMGGSDEMRLEMLELFHQQSTSTIAELEQAFKSHNIKQVRFLAHRMKYQIDILAGDESKQLIRELENWESDSLAEATPAFERLDKQVKGLLRQAENHMATIKS